MTLKQSCITFLKRTTVFFDSCRNMCLYLSVRLTVTLIIYYMSIYETYNSLLYSLLCSLSYSLLCNVTNGLLALNVKNLAGHKVLKTLHFPQKNKCSKSQKVLTKSNKYRLQPGHSRPLHTNIRPPKFSAKIQKFTPT